MAVARLNTNTMKNAVASVSGDTGFTVNAGTNTCAFVVIGYDASNGMSVTGVTLGGQTCISAGAAAAGGTPQFAYCEVWYLVNPPTGTAPSGPALSITVAGTVQDVYYNVVVFSGVNQTTPVRAGTYQATHGTTSTTLSLVVASNTNDLTLTALNSAGPVISGTNQTSDGINTSGGDAAASDHATTAATSVTHTWTVGGTATGYTIVGFSINGDSGAGPLTLYANNPIQGGSNAGLLALSAPTASTSTTGWTVGTTAATQYSRGTYNTEVPTANFTATAQPSGAPVNLGEDCFRLSAQTSGVFSAGTWYSTVSVIAVTSGGIQDGQAQFRYWRSLNADGTSATEITQGIMVGSRITELSTTVAQSSSASTQVSTQTFNNEYLFLQLGWETL